MSIFSKIGHFFQKIGDGIKNAFDSAFDTLKKMLTMVTGVLKQLVQSAINLAEAMATGNFQKMGEALKDLGNTLMEAASLPGDMLSVAVCNAVRTIMKTASSVLGMKEQPWMNDIINIANVASHFTSMASAAKFMAEEALSKAAGNGSEIEMAAGSVKDITSAPPKDPGTHTGKDHVTTI